MNATVTQSDLKRALNRVKPATAARSTMASLQSAFFSSEEGRLGLSACNLNMEITEWIPATIHEAGDLMLPVGRLLATVAELPGGAVRIKINGTRANLRCANASLEIPFLDPKDYTPLECKNQVAFSMPQRQLKQILRQTVPFVFQDEERMTLCGVCFQITGSDLKAIGGGGHRVTVLKHTIQAQIDEPFERIIPTASVSAILGLLDDKDDLAVLTFDKSFMSVTFGSTEFTTKVIEGKYPSISQIVMDNPASKIQVGREELQATLRLMRATLDAAENPAVEFAFSKNSLTLSTRSQSSAKVEIAVKYAGQPFKVRLNPGYALDITNVLDADDISIEYTDSLSPLCFRSDSFMGAIMLLRNDPTP